MDKDLGRKTETFANGYANPVSTFSGIITETGLRASEYNEPVPTNTGLPGKGYARCDRKGDERVQEDGEFVENVLAYFHAGDTLSPRLPASGVGPTTYTYDPGNPIPTIGGSFSSQRLLVESGAFDQKDLYS